MRVLGRPDVLSAAADQDLGGPDDRARRSCLAGPVTGNLKAAEMASTPLGGAPGMDYCGAGMVSMSTAAPLLLAGGNLKENFPAAVGLTIVAVLVLVGVFFGVDFLRHKLRR